MFLLHNDLDVRVCKEKRKRTAQEINPGVYAHLFYFLLALHHL